MPEAYYIILFGSIFTLLHGIEQITGRARRNRLDYITAIVMADVALILYNHAILSTDRLFLRQQNLFFYLTSLYAIGPLNYLYYYSLINGKINLSLRLNIHLLPAFCIFVIELIAILLPGKFGDGFYSSIYAEKISLFTILLFVGGSIFILYQLFFMYQCCKILENACFFKGIYIALFLESINVLTPLPVLLWLITKQHHLYAIASFMTVLVILVLFLLHRRFPTLFDAIADAIRKEKYGRDHLAKVDLSYLFEKMRYLMDDEKIFLNPDITLNEMSQKLQVTPHQLSQFLNEHCKTRFNHFINKYRIEEAKKIFESDRNANIISVAYHVGFNSKSSFNKIFKQYTGVTPSEFKARHFKREIFSSN